MARKSGWQEFTENFNGVYDTFTKAAQGYETSRVMNDKKFTGEGGLGAGLEGSALEEARYKALGDIQAKYGDAEGALAMRNSYQSLRNTTRENEIGDATQDDVIFQRGPGASNEVRARTNASNASATSSLASARNSDNLVFDRNAKRPGVLENQALINVGLGLGHEGQSTENAAAALRLQLDRDTYEFEVEQARIAVDQANATLGSTDAGTENTEARTLSLLTMLPNEVEQALANINLTEVQTNRITELLFGEKALQGQQLLSAISAMGLNEAQTEAIVAKLPGQTALLDAQAELTGANADRQALDNANLAATSGSTNDLTNLNNMLGINVAEEALKSASIEDRILSDVMGSGFETAAEADAETIRLIEASDMPIERKQVLISTIQQMGLEKLGTEGAAFTQAGMNALAQGLDAGIEWYDTVDNNDTLRIDRGDDGTVRVMRTLGENVTELFSANGPDAEREIMATLAVQISKPSTALTVAAEMANLTNVKARTDQADASTRLINEQVFTEMMQDDAVGARTALVEAQTDLVREQIESSRAGIGKSREIAEQGLAALMRSPEYLYMGSEEGGLEQQQAAVEMYRRTMGMTPGRPTQAELDAMSPEDRALFEQ